MIGDVAAFSAVLEQGAPLSSARVETDGDAAFLTELFVQCSPLVGWLPDALLTGQARAQDLGYRAAFPTAARIIVMTAGRPIGRILIERTTDCSLLVDIAVLPAARSGGVGLAMLRAWVKIADGEGLPCRLRVLKDNPVTGLYRWLGFRPVPAEEDGASWVMQRPLAARS